MTDASLFSAHAHVHTSLALLKDHAGFLLLKKQCVFVPGQFKKIVINSKKNFPTNLNNKFAQEKMMKNFKKVIKYFYSRLQWYFSLVQFSCSVVSNALRPHESQHARPPCPSQTPEFAQTHAHQVSDAIQPSHPPSSPSPPAPNPSQH